MVFFSFISIIVIFIVDIIGSIIIIKYITLWFIPIFIVTTNNVRELSSLTFLLLPSNSYLPILFLIFSSYLFSNSLLISNLIFILPLCFS